MQQNGLFSPVWGGIELPGNRIRLVEQCQRRGFAIIYDELWTDYLPHIGGIGVLLYCFLKHMAGRDMPNPCSKEWETEVCQVLGLSVTESHSAWARLQEMGLISLVDGGYELCDTSRAAPPPVPAPVIPKPRDNSLYAQVELAFGRVLNSSETARLEELEEEYPVEHILLAVQTAVQEQAGTMPYVTRVLADWKRHKLADTTEVLAYLEARKQAILSKEIVKGRRNARIPQVKPSDLAGYDDPELILKRMKQAARGED